MKTKEKQKLITKTKQKEKKIKVALNALQFIFNLKKVESS